MIFFLLLDFCIYYFAILTALSYWFFFFKLMFRIDRALSLSLSLSFVILFSRTFSP